MKILVWGRPYFLEEAGFGLREIRESEQMLALALAPNFYVFIQEIFIEHE